ncbi:apolipoprotein L3-like [Xiphias gladius]|uniref:apolipoprotein L3-like n=1 Tax=Xiphias gladius TaxID=8245 RepID=UPI001A9918D0|nr:apolipoprotein L3-like [Xiphias gladius]
MSQPPVPAPRRQFSPRDQTEDTEPSKCSSTPQSPTKSPKGGLVCSTPPPVSPKKWTVKKSSGGSETLNGSLEIVTAGQSINGNCKAQPPPLPPKPPKQEPDDENEILDANSLLGWWKESKSWDSLCKGLNPTGRRETQIIKIKAEQLHKVVQVYVLLLAEHAGTLKEHTSELLGIADNLDKVSKGTKIAAITGGATTVAGGVAAAAGVILSPFTLGASLALTAVGVGVAAAGGVTGASAAIANKVNASHDRKKIDKIFQEYEDLMVEIKDCLKFVNEGMEKLKEHSLSVLSEARKDSVRVARVVDLAVTGGASARVVEAKSRASGLIQGFALGMDFYFTKEKDGQKLKKGLESKFAKKIRKLAMELINGLDELMQISDLFCKRCPWE